MNMKPNWIWIGVVCCAACQVPTPSPKDEKPQVQNVVLLDTLAAFEMAFQAQPTRVARVWQFPVGPPLANGYYNAQPFGENEHLGDDWNGTGGGNSDLGDAVFVCADGWVSQAINHGGGWGNVVRVVHKLPAGDSLQYVESLYAHLDTMLVQRGDWLQEGATLGTIGNAEGRYWAHLHFELRNRPQRPLGGGYGRPNGYLDPTKWIRQRME